ncbi:zf-CCHC domain-containing protein, partial [Tanacetum coccineum]
AKDVWNSLIITHQGNKQVKDNKIDLFVQKYEVVISDDETIDCTIARFNTIITSFKALDESFSSRNHVRKFLRALPTKWHPKVTAIEESKDLLTLPLDELIGNLKVYEVVLEKDSKASKVKKEKRRGKFVRQPHDDKKCFWKVKEGKKGNEDQRCFKCGDPNHFISDCPKHSFNDQKAFVGGCWSESDEEDESKRDEIYIMALDNNEVLSDTPYYSRSSLDSE